MSLNCDVVMDCVALYKDGAVSEGTKKAVDAHIKECPDCRKYYKQYDSINTLAASRQNVDLDDTTEKFAALSASLQKRRRFFAACFSLFAAITIFSLIFSILTGRKNKN